MRRELIKRVLWIVCVTAVCWLAGCMMLRPSGIERKAGGGEVVVVLHGLNRTSRAMGKMTDTLAQEGYTVLNCNYPSRSGSIAALAEGVHQDITPHLAQAEAVHFVTHSMGGIVLRKMLKEHPLPNMGRAVMLGPPNQGSELADALGSWWAYRWVNGPSGDELGTSTNSIPARLGAPAFSLGVIAGDRTMNPLYSWIIPGADDGKVAVERAKVEGMADFRCLHVTHTWMMRNPNVIRQTLHFLRNGCFEGTGI